MERIDGGEKGKNRVAWCFLTTKLYTKCYEINLLHLNSIEYWNENKQKIEKSKHTAVATEMKQQQNRKKCCGLLSSQRNHKTNSTIYKDVWSDAQSYRSMALGENPHIKFIYATYKPKTHIHTRVYFYNMDICVCCMYTFN